MPVHAREPQRSIGDAVELGQRRRRAVTPAGFVPPVQVHRTLTGRRDRPHDVEELGRGAHRSELGRLVVDPGAGQVHVGVDEPRQDRGPRQVDRAVGLRGLADPDAFDVATVDQDPLPHRRVRQGVDARSSVQGLHRRASLAPERPGEMQFAVRARHRSPETALAAPRPRSVGHDPRLGLVRPQADATRAPSGRPTGRPRCRRRTGRRRRPTAGARRPPPAALGRPAPGRRWPGPPRRPDRPGGPPRRRARGPRGTPRPRTPWGCPPRGGPRRRSRATSTRSSGGRRRTRPDLAGARDPRAVPRTADVRAARAGGRVRAGERSTTPPGWPSRPATAAPRSPHAERATSST